jgi:hypothetical protein
MRPASAFVPAIGRKVPINTTIFCTKKQVGKKDPNKKSAKEGRKGGCTDSNVS